MVQSKGKTKGTEYFVNPDYLRRLNYKGKTNLKKIEPYRLQELIFQDLNIYPESPIGDIHVRIGDEIPKRKLKVALDHMVHAGQVARTGEKRWTRYSINEMPQNNV